MKTLVFIVIVLSFISCNKNAENLSGRLVKMESTDYTGQVLTTDYKYDSQKRIIEIRQYLNNFDSAYVVTINYNGNEITLLSNPNTEPLYDQSEEVRLTVDESGKLLRRIEFIHGISKSYPGQPPETFRYDTLIYEYDVAGLLKSTSESMYDSIFVNANFTSSTRLSSNVSYTNSGGNLISTDEYVVYPRITRQGSNVDTSGGSSEYHNTFSYSKGFPNLADFRNAVILNEFKLYYESPFNSNYKNMPDQVVRNSTDRDSRGAIIFTGSSTIDMDRAYGSDGLLTSVNIPSHNTPYNNIQFIYGK
ncbi:MAG: hypothetical protein C5B52_04965 [Bacteroidetes bacterium]|nr:MAG: hypothetical protein C5B52_04965 [Bacteroidota bacterium]